MFFGSKKKKMQKMKNLRLALVKIIVRRFCLFLILSIEHIKIVILSTLSVPCISVVVGFQNIKSFFLEDDWKNSHTKKKTTEKTSRSVGLNTTFLKNAKSDYWERMAGVCFFQVTWGNPASKLNEKKKKLNVYYIK